MTAPRVEAALSSTTAFATRPTMTVFGHRYVGIEFQVHDGDHRFSLVIHGDADDRAWFARRLRELADEVDAWKPR